MGGRVRGESREKIRRKHIREREMVREKRGKRREQTWVRVEE